VEGRLDVANQIIEDLCDRITGWSGRVGHRCESSAAV
jgi:hypothetical protein